MSDELATIAPATRQNPFVPSANNAATTCGMALGVLFIVYQHGHGIDYPAGQEATIAGAIGAIFSYIHSVAASLIERFAPSQ